MKVHRMILAALVVVCCSTANAAVKHRYSFSGNLNDSAGGAHGTLVDAGVPTATFAGGQLDLSANVGQGSNNITEDAFVDLPNGIISAAASSGVSGALTVELWATISEQHTWQRFADFGTSNDGENTSNGGGNAPYFYLAANSGRFSNGLATEVHQIGGPEREVGIAGPAPLNQQIHLVGTYDKNDTSSGPNGTLKLYNNGALAGAAELPPNLDLNTFADNNNWLGRSQWPDPVFDGLFNEVRIYDDAISAARVATNFQLGPDSVPEPASVALVGLAGMALVAAGRRAMRRRR